jgi:hypothetical protein
MAFDLGSIYPAAVNLTDANGNPVNATSVTLTITLPDTSTVTPTVTNPPATTGAYQLQYLTVQPGRHLVRWVFTGPNSSYTDVFDVKEANPPSIISLADAKQQLGILPSNTTDDDEIRMWMAATTKSIEDYKHEVTAQRTIVEIFGYPNTYAGFGQFLGFGPNVRVMHIPVIALQSIVAENGTLTWTIPGNIDVETFSGLLTVINGPPITGRVVITYTAGYQIMPYNYILGARMLLQHMWETRRGPGGQSGVTGPEELADFRHYTSLPRKVTEMLGPPRPVVA